MRQDPPELFKALAVDTRLRIIELLKEKGALGAKAIAAELNITPAAVSQHLRTLKQAGLVKAERQGYWIPYSVDTKALEQCGQALNEVCRCGAGAGGGACHGNDLSSLKAREQWLRNELENVRARIEHLENQT